MLNKTKSQIVITMKHIDHASKLYDFLKRAMGEAGQGGDLVLTCNDTTDFIGHDVRCIGTKHIIYEK